MGREKILLIVAARGGSQGIKNKNIRELCGMPLIARTILQAKRWGKANRIICTTDSEEIASIAKKYGADIPFIRPSELATDNSGKIEVLQHAVRVVEQQDGQTYGIIIDLDPTAPIRTTDDIDNALCLFIERRPKSLFSVVRCRRNPYFNMVEIDSEGFAALVKNVDSTIKRRQDAPRVYDMNASIYVYDRNYLLDKETRSAISNRSLIYLMGDISAFDIDREVDLEFIEFLVSKGMVSL